MKIETDKIQNYFSCEMDPPLVTPEQIELYGNKQQRPLLLDANVVAYFGDLFGKSKTQNKGRAGKGPSYTASAQNRS